MPSADRHWKVLVLAQYYPPDMGGASARVSNVVRGLLALGNRVQVVTAFPHYPLGKVPLRYRGKIIAKEDSGGARVFRSWVPPIPHSSPRNRVILHLSFILTSLFALPFLEDFDVIWAANPNLFSFIPSMVYRFIKRKPIVRNVDDLWPEQFYDLGLVKSNAVRRILDSFSSKSYNSSVAITPISNAQGQSIQSRYHIDKSKIFVIEVGIGELPPTQPYDMHGRFLVVYSGILGPGYNFDMVLEAAQRLAGTRDVAFLVRGTGELAADLRSKIARMRLTNLELDARFVSKEELAGILAKASAFLMPLSGGSFEAGVPAKLFEYESFGRPVICVSAGESARVVEGSGSGIVVSPNDVGGFVRAITTLSADRQLAMRMGENGLRHVRSGFTSLQLGERFCRMLEEVVPPRNTRPGSE